MKILFQSIFLILFLFAIVFGTIILTIKISEEKTSIKYTEITEYNYNSINDTVQQSKDLSLQEKVNFQKNYFLFGKKIIGYKVKDVIKQIEY